MRKEIDARERNREKYNIIYDDFRKYSNDTKNKI